jgi:Fe-S-cluster-containing hydrogenase component 2
MTVKLPSTPVIAGSTRDLTKATTLLGSDQSEFQSGCLECPDQPCVSYSHDEIAKSVGFDGPYSPDTNVCPNGSIIKTASGPPAVDSSTCLGCGLCVARCPVGAIHLNPTSLTASVSPADTSHYRSATSTAEFDILRQEIAELVPDTTPTFGDLELVARQTERISEVLGVKPNPAELRLLVRNILISAGATARLKNTGDNNAVSELVAASDDWVLIAEIDPTGDTLDAMRRSIAGCAIAIGRYGISRDKLAAVAVVMKLPNKRVDCYGVVSDVVERLELQSAVVPVGLLLLFARGGLELIGELWPHLHLVGSQEFLNAVQAVLGSIPDPVAAGLLPSK